MFLWAQWYIKLYIGGNLRFSEISKLFSWLDISKGKRQCKLENSTWHLKILRHPNLVVCSIDQIFQIIKTLSVLSWNMLIFRICLCFGWYSYLTMTESKLIHTFNYIILKELYDQSLKRYSNSLIITPDTNKILDHN